MPIYEYVCEACGRLTEVMQKVSDPPPAACDECGDPRLAKLVSRTSFHLKGGGWYADLYSSAGKGKAEPAGGTAKPAPKPEGPGGSSGSGSAGGGTPGGTSGGTSAGGKSGGTSGGGTSGGASGGKSGGGST